MSGQSRDPAGRLARLFGRVIATAWPPARRAARQAAAEEVARWERSGEAGYDAMYEAHNYRDAKDAYDDAREGLFRAARIAEEAGLKEDAARLKARLDHVINVWSHQFRS